VSITEYPLPANISQPNLIRTAPDGSIWFTGNNTGQGALHRIAPDGQVTGVSGGMYPLGGFAFGADGNIWIGVGTYIREITPQGALLHDYPIPSTQHVQYPQLSVTLGPDGNIWYTEYGPSQDGPDVIGRLTPGGVITEFPIPFPACDIVAGPDGNLWFDATALHMIGRIAPTGDGLTTFSVADNTYVHPNGGPAAFRGLVFDSSGNLWTVPSVSNAIVELNTAGQVLNVFDDPDAPAYLTLGADGNIWYTEFGPPYSADGGNRIGRITPQGNITKYAIPTPNAGADVITTGLDGSIWFTEYNANQIGRISLNSAPAANAGGPYTTTYGSGVTLNGSASSDPDGDPLTYTWTVNGHPGAATGVAPTLSWTQLQALGVTAAGPYTVSVAVSDGVNPPVSSAPTLLTVGKAYPTVTVASGSFIYDGQPHPATGSVAGVGGENLGTPAFTYSYTDDSGNVVTSTSPPVDPGYYTVAASFAENTNYNAASATATIMIAYDAAVLTDLSHAFNAGRTIPIKIQLLDANGNNLSGSDITLTAVHLWRVNADGSRTEVTLQDAGGSNPGNLFRYDAGLGGYIFNLSTKGLTAGTYAFDWEAYGDPTDHELSFRLI